MRRVAFAVLIIACSPGVPRPAAPPVDAVAAPSPAPPPAAPAPSAEEVDGLLDVRTLDPSIAVDLRYATSDNFTGAPLPGYVPGRALLRREAAVALARAQADLRADGLGLVVLDAHRPRQASEAMVEWARREGRLELLRDGYIAARSRHNLGLAVDVTLRDLATGEPLDMGTPFDTFAPAAHAGGATGPAAARRARLARAMVSAGFEPYHREWWHFSYPLRKERR